jgi:FlaA1/EpsC-like NDP-sugar epimerase
MSEGFLQKMSVLSRPQKQALMAITDTLLLLFSGWVAYATRLNELFIPNLQQALVLLAAPVIALPIFVRIGMYRSVIRYVDGYALWTTVQAMTTAAVLWAALAFLTKMTGLSGVPRSVPLIYWALGTLLVGGSRYAARWLLWAPLRAQYRGRQALIFGADEAGRQMAAALRQGRELFPAGFIEDDAGLIGRDVNGLRVYPRSELPHLIEHFGIADIIVSLTLASSARRREVVAFLEQYPVRVRILPALADLAQGSQLVNLVREVDVGDLLGRDPVAADPELLGHCISGRTVLVTGAGGSIGGELCRQIVALAPARLILLEQSEFALYQIERSLRGMIARPPVACLGSVRDAELVARLMREHGVQTVYHAAAHKHVPLVEDNLLEGVRNNVCGTLTLARAAFAAGVETFVLISTDKAVRPSNVMGATKRWGELIIQDLARQAAQRGSPQCFCAVRFGNVLGSSGSVIPLFKEQIAQGGPVTVTHAETTRYFMSIHEAVELVIQAGSMARSGEVYLLDMGEPMKIMDLARAMLRLSHLTERSPLNPEGDIEIVLTGLRPGEKLHEELLIASHGVKGTRHPRIMQANDPVLSAVELSQAIEALEQAIEAGDLAEVRRRLFDLASDVRGLEPARVPTQVEPGAKVVPFRASP